MRKVLFLALLVVFAGLGLSVQPTVAKEKKAKTGQPSDARWSGIIVRGSKDASTLTVSRHGTQKIIHYDSSTKWTQGTKIVDAAQVKDGARVICLGKNDEKGNFNATRIDLRTP